MIAVVPNRAVSIADGPGSAAFLVGPRGSSSPPALTSAAGLGEEGAQTIAGLESMPMAPPPHGLCAPAGIFDDARHGGCEDKQKIESPRAFDLGSGDSDVEVRDGCWDSHVNGGIDVKSQSRRPATSSKEGNNVVDVQDDREEELRGSGSCASAIGRHFLQVGGSTSG